MQNYKHSLFLLFLSICFFACEEDALELNPGQIPVLNFGDSIQLSANMDVDWKLLPEGLASISAEGLLIAGDSSGSIVLEVVSKGDETNRIEQNVFISNRAESINPLLAGGHIIYLRHAIARTGNDLFNLGPNGWHLSCSSDTARQLSPSGFVQAQELGEAFRKLEIPLADTIYVSEYCRCIQTVEELALDKPYVTEKDITFFVYEETERHAKTQAFINSFTPGDKNVLIVSHSFGPGSTYQQPQQGYSVIFKKGNTEPEFQTVIRDDEFILLK
ncbi:MAG: histidine phosphatase family protein [Bacteroidia bacterium]|nr:histidine phosphatase family protein [Bacteroidia bacterium]